MSEFMKCYKIIVLGAGGVGKSALTLRLITNKFQKDWDPTIEDCYTTTMKVDDISFRLEIIDTAGQEEFSNMMDGWVRDAQGYVLVFDITNKDSIEHLKIIRGKIAKYRGDDTPGPVVVAGNKCDLRNDSDSQISKSEALAVTEEWGYKYIDTSAKDGVGHKEVFEQVIRELRKQESLPPDSGGSTACCMIM